MDVPRSLIIRLAIPAEEFVRLYSGEARDVIALAETGETVRFPGSVLRGEVTHDGVYGRYRLSYDGDGRFVSIARL